MLRYGCNDRHVLFGVSWIEKSHGSSRKLGCTRECKEYKHKYKDRNSKCHSQSSQSLELLTGQVCSYVLNYNVGVHDEEHTVGG